MANKELETKLKTLMKRWRNPLKYSKEPDWCSKYCKAKSLIQKELLEFLRRNKSEVSLDTFAEIVGRGGTTGSLYKLAFSEILARKLSFKEIKKFSRNSMALKDACEIYMKFICENKLSAQEIIGIIFSDGNSDEFETMLASAIRDRYSREAYKEIQVWRKKRNKETFEKFARIGLW